MIDGAGEEVGSGGVGEIDGGASEEIGGGGPNAEPGGGEDAVLRLR